MLLVEVLSTLKVVASSDCEIGDESEVSEPQLLLTEGDGENPLILQMALPSIMFFKASTTYNIIDYSMTKHVN